MILVLLVPTVLGFTLGEAIRSAVPGVLGVIVGFGLVHLLHLGSRTLRRQRDALDQEIQALNGEIEELEAAGRGG